MNATVKSLSILLRHTRSFADGGRGIHPIIWQPMLSELFDFLHIFKQKDPIFTAIITENWI